MADSVQSPWDDHYLWHPFTQMKAWREEGAPIIREGRGCFLYDDQGRKLLDGISSLWCNVHGHRHPHIDKAVSDQLGKLAHSTLLGLSSEVAEDLARRLVAIAPRGLRWAFYSDSGATAVEIALKMAFQYWRNRGQPGRSRYVVLENAYHGDTIGSVSVGGIDLFHQIFRPLLFHSDRVAAPHCLRCPMGIEAKDRQSCDLACAGLIEAVLEAKAHETVAVVLEPLVQGAAGIVTHPPGYLRRVRHLCDRYGVLLICDEVATGFGRTGRMFACEHEGVSPDLMAVAKGLTGGYLPVAATLATHEIFEAFLADHAEGKQFFHGHTFTGNALGCAAAVASLEVFEQQDVLAKLQPKIARLEAGLASLQHHPHVLEVRQRGTMVGIELAREPASDTPFDPALRMGHQVVLAARQRGVIVRPLGDVVVLMPALAMGHDELDLLIQVVKDSIDEVTTKVVGR